MSPHIANRPQNRQTPPNFEMLFLRHRERVYRMAYGMLSNRTDAEDVTQEAFLRAWANYHRFDTAGSFEAWMYRIVSNLCIEQFYRRKRRPEISLDGLTDSGWSSLWDSREMAAATVCPHRCLMAALEREEVQQAVKELPPAYRDVALLLLQERSYAEISKMLDCPIGTVRSRVYRARVKMRKALAYQQARKADLSQNDPVNA